MSPPRARLAVAPAAFAVVLLASCGTATPDASSSGEASVEQDLIAPDAVIGFQFVAGIGDAIYTARVDGSERAQLIDLEGSSFHPDWSPGGDRLPFRLSAADTPDQIWIANAEGSAAEVVEPCAAPCFAADYPAWSSDGTSLAYTVYDAPLADGLPPAGSTIRIVDITTGAVRDVARSEPGEILDQVRWSPDGTRLAVQIDHFEPDGTESAQYVGVLSIDTGAVTRLTEGDVFAGYPDWHPTAELIVFCTYDLSAFPSLPEGVASNLYTIAADGSDLTQLTENAPDESRVSQPSWTLDGRAVLLTLDDLGNRSAAIVSGTGGEIVRIGGSGATHVRQVPTG